MAVFKHKRKKVAVLSYDYREDVAWAEVKEALAHLGITLSVCTVNTNGDDFAVVLSNREMTKAEAKKVYRDTWYKLEEFED